MSLAELAEEDVRRLRRAELQLHPGQNLIWGANASGKTSLLEAVFLRRESGSTGAYRRYKAEEGAPFVSAVVPEA